MMRRRRDVLERLRHQIVSALHFGRLNTGDRLPSARKLAEQLKADPRVVAAAYRRLEREGLVLRKPGSRRFYSAWGATNSDGGGVVTHTTEWIVHILRQGLANGFGALQFTEQLRRSLTTVRLTAACIECNSDHIRWLCGEVSEDYGIKGLPVDSSALTPDAIPSEMLKADIWITTAFHAREVKDLADRQSKRLVVVKLHNAIVAEVTDLLGREPVYFLCTDPRTGAKLRKLYADVGPPDNIRPFIVGQDDLKSIPKNASAWVFRSAREKLGSAPAHLRPLSTARIFSSETAHELLTIVVEANMKAVAVLEQSSAG